MKDRESYKQYNSAPSLSKKSFILNSVKNRHTKVIDSCRFRNSNYSPLIEKHQFSHYANINEKTPNDFEIAGHHLLNRNMFSKKIMISNKKIHIFSEFKFCG